MHFAGPGGGVKLMQADPNTPVESILDDAAVKANPFLQGKTASWVIAWADKKMANAAASKSNARPQPAPWPGRPPLPYLAQTQAVEPAFGATSWPPHPTSPNMLPPDAARPFAGAPPAAPPPFVDGTLQAQQVLDNSLPPPRAAPWDLSDRFGTWNALGGVFGPRSGASGGLGRTGAAPDAFSPDAVDMRRPIRSLVRERLFDVGAPAVSFVPRTAPPDPDRPATLGERFGIFNGQPMADPPLLPSIFGLPDASGASSTNLDDWLADLMRPRSRR